MGRSREGKLWSSTSAKPKRKSLPVPAASSSSTKTAKRDRKGKAKALPVKKTAFVDTRFRYQTLSAKLNAISVDLSSLLDRSQAYAFESDLEASEDEGEASTSTKQSSETPFSKQLASLVLLNTTTPFVIFSRQVAPASRSLPLIVHHRHRIVKSIVDALAGPGSALCADAVIELIPQFLNTLPSYALLEPLMPQLLAGLIDLSTSSTTDPAHLEKAVQTIAFIFRELARELVKQPDYCWNFLRVALGAAPRKQPALAEPIVADASDDEDLFDGEEIADLPQPSIDGLRLEASLDDSAATMEEVAEPVTPTLATPTRRKIVKPQIRHLLASAFAFLIRKSSASQLDDFFEIMFADLQELVAADDASIDALAQSVAWIVVESVQSVEHQLHSHAPSIFKAFLTIASRHCDDSSWPLRTVEAALTAVLHQTRSDPFTASADVIIQHASSQIESTNKAAQIFALSVLDTLSAVRSANRLSARGRNSIWIALQQQLHSNLSDPDLLSGLTEVVSNLLLTADLQETLGKARISLEALFTPERRRYAYYLARVLASQKASHFGAVVLSRVLHLAISDLSQTDEAWLLLAFLARENQLLDMATIDRGVWPAKLRLQIARLADDLGSSSGDATAATFAKLVVAEYHPILLESQTTEFLAKFALTLQSVHDARSRYMTSANNPATLLAQILRTLTAATTTTMAGLSLDITIDCHHWCAEVLQATPTQSKNVCTSNEGPSPDRINALIRNVLSESKELRVASLKMLLHICSNEKYAALKSTVEAAVRVEETSLTFQQARELGMYVRKVAINARASNSEVAISVAVHLSAALLKVNFKPIWSDATQNLLDLLQHSPAQTWPVISSQLEKVARYKTDLIQSPSPTWRYTADTYREQQEDLLSSSEFVCSHRKAVHVVYSRLEHLGSVHNALDALFAIDIDPTSRLVYSSYEYQLLQVLRKSPAIVAQYGRFFVQLFFDLFADKDTSDEVEAETDAEGGLSTRSDQPPMSGKLTRQRLRSWQEVIVVLPNPKALYRSDDLRAFHTDMLSHGDSAIQTLAVDCLLAYKTAQLAPHKDMLKGLLNGSAMRENLLGFAELLQSGTVVGDDRKILVPIVVRLLYGILTSRSSVHSDSAYGQSARRTAIMSTLRELMPTELDTLVDLMLAPFGTLSISEQDLARVQLNEGFTAKRQIGLLTLLAELIKHLCSSLVHRMPDIAGALTVLLCSSQRLIDEAASGSTINACRKIRQLGLKRLKELFERDIDFTFDAYLAVIFATVISPRIPTFAVENSQALSAMFELFITWSNEPAYAHFLSRYDARLIPALYDCLAVDNVRPAVIIGVLEVINNLLTNARESSIEGKMDDGVLRLSHLLDCLTANLRHRPTSLASRDVLGQSQLKTLSALAPSIENGDQANKLLVLLLALIDKPFKQVPDSVKSDLLAIATRLVGSAFDDDNAVGFVQAYKSVSRCLETVQLRAGRENAVACIGALSLSHDSDELAVTASLIGDLEAYSGRRLGEPDFERRLSAFNKINETLYSTLTEMQWRPILHSLLFHMRDINEYAIRSNATFGLCRFLEAVPGSSIPLDSLIEPLLLPGLTAAMLSPHEPVRAEIMTVLDAAAKLKIESANLKQLAALTAGNDVEASFFTNIYHVQIHRRKRAMQRLGNTALKGSLSSALVKSLFIPLLRHYIAGASDIKDQELINEAVLAMGQTAAALEWRAYIALVGQYTRQVKVAKAAESADATSAQQKLAIRTLVAILRNFRLAAHPEHRAEQIEATRVRFLPRLMRMLEQRDEAEAINRIPLAEGIATVLQQMPGDARRRQVLSLLTALAGILKSKAQDVRDSTRATICTISTALGPEYLADLVKELKEALARGPQLHILAMTIHALLARHVAAGTPEFDEALSVAVPVLANDCFGQPAKERASQDFRSKTKVKEVRAFKSEDSFQILAEHMSPTSTPILLAPIRDLLQQTEGSKALQHAQDVLRRIAQGIRLNKNFDNNTLLELCNALISQNTDFLRPRPKRVKTKAAAADYRIQMSAKVAIEDDHFRQNAHIFVSFGLDLLNASFKAARYDMRDSATVAKLDPLIEVVGNTLFSDHTDVLSRSLKAAASLVHFPLTSVSKASPLVLSQVFSILQDMGSAQTEVSQNAYKTLAVILRDCPNVKVEEDELVSVLHTIKAGIEDPDDQATMFTLLRAVMARKLVAPEIYELMDKIAETLVTNQTSQVRQICRSVYLQFLLDYPQGKQRLHQSMTFLAKNLSYVYESGRASVLEILSAIIGKFNQDLVAQHADMLFTALVLCLGNEQAARCREMSIEVLKALHARLTPSLRKQQRDLLALWAAGDGNKVLQRTALQVLGALNAAPSPTVLAPMFAVIRESALHIGTDQLEDSEIDWQTSYQALNAIAKQLPGLDAASVFTPDLDWASIQSHLTFPHAWVRLATSRLLGALYDLGKDLVATGKLPEEHILSTASLLDAAFKSVRQLESEHLTDELATQAIRNILFTFKAFQARHPLVINSAVSADYSPAQEPVRWMLDRLTRRLRNAYVHRPSVYNGDQRVWSREALSLLKLLAAIVQQLEPEALAAVLGDLVSPLYNLIEDGNTADPQVVEIQNLAIEFRELLQAKAGVSAVATAYSTVKQAAIDRRNQRKAAAAVAVVNDPETEARRREKRAAVRSVAKKRKAESYARKKENYGDIKLKKSKY
ncbi:uncharacterized protein L969DRAFT_89878 [Mixia osmundae IAM 14324]|uniref:Uncharacterized protein n=1 Tax=Mixia osmundae (strain CBS 9802 / IAM 14324 / JCM 22182 / KY 12970) TaxID=764103 RepID=G7DWG0_MIXOS|nr:uncharacterized protein L969DRAFT_89878 [Mixia osmundae IAM 14324]KEI37322.1 hypothetical protein L969DRAFT_89878 [Mixia osmundae IAM 14324]GAA94920.1 hypothetical protein E5Q_01575 [Mixia osmundae IAM 14324]